MDLGLVLILIAIVGLSSFAMTKIKPKFWVFKIFLAGLIVACVNAFILPFQPEDAAWLLINAVTVCLLGWNVCATKTKGGIIIGLIIIAIGVVFLVGGVSIIANTPIGQNVSDILQIVSNGWNEFVDRGGDSFNPS